MDLHQRYGLTRVINACGKMTHLSGAVVRPEVAAVAAESLQHFFYLEELQALADQVIARVTGAEAGCVTACTAAGITLSVAACMAGGDLGKVLQLPDATGMKRRVVIQAGHCVNYGQPITQAIRLAGAEPVVTGSVNSCSEAEWLLAVSHPETVAALVVESHHTVRHGCLPLARVVELCRGYGVPVIVDGAAQDLRFSELLAAGPDLVIASAHKFLCSTTGGVVAGRRALVRAVQLQHRGIGRGMKAGKEAILGAVAALEYRETEDLSAWTAEQDRRVRLIHHLLSGISGLTLSTDPDPNGCPFSRARITPDPAVTGFTARSLADALAHGNPSIVVRAHHAEEGFFYVDAVELTDPEIHLTCERIRSFLTHVPPVQAPTRQH